MYHTIPELPPSKSDACQVLLEREPGSHAHFFDFLRMEIPDGADAFVVVTYQDSNGASCEERFEFATFGDGTFNWNEVRAQP